MVSSNPPVSAMRNMQWDPLWALLESKAEIHRNDFDRDTFDKVLPPNFVLMKQGATDPASMYTAIPSLFLSYAMRDDFLLREGRSQEAFTAEFGEPPWTAVNRVLQGAGLRYEALPPLVPKTSWTRVYNGDYRLELRNLETGVVVSPSSLSSGERVIFLTAIWSYFFSQSALTSRATLLLLDEPDAHLHPALTRVFLRVIRDELVDRRGMRVIATTHSPSTVALTEENELFVMSTDEPRVRPVVNKWEAVTRLTAGLVTVGTHTKAVFVEDKQDAAFYRAVQTILIRGVQLDVGFDAARSLNFIPASDGKPGGGKNMVIGNVEKIDTTQVAGIVDRDEDEKPVGRVHAGDRRHLESYLLDPIFAYSLLLEDNVTNRPNFAIGIDHQYSRSILTLTTDVLQKIVDGMVGIYAECIEPGVCDRVEITYLGGVKVLLPQWLLTCDMKRLIQPLKRKLGVSWDQEMLIRKYEVLGIVPVEIAEMLVRIQRA